MFLITTISSGAKLLPHFLAHYRWLGVDRFFLVVDTLRDQGLPGRVQEMAMGYPVVLFPTHLSGRGDLDARIANALRKEYVGKDEWCMLADLDEFHEYPAPLTAITSYPCDHVIGEFLDRVAANGGLPEVNENSLWSQFPLGCLLTQNIARAMSTKVMMIKGPDTAVNAGHHRAFSSAPFPKRGVVHHFKWSAGLLERLKSKIEGQKGHNLAGWPNSVRLLDFLEGKDRIDVEDPRLQSRRARNPPFSEI